MDESKEIIKEQLRNIPENLRKYVSGSFWSDSVAKIGIQFNVPKEKQVDLENEVLFVLICLEPPKDFVENIKKGVGLDENTARKVADSVNGSIFNPVMSSIKSYWDSLPKEAVGQAPTPQNTRVGEPTGGIGFKSYDSFEQAILRQAQAMRPASVPRDTRDYGLAKPAQAPNNLPGAQQNFASQNLNGQATQTPNVASRPQINTPPVDLSPKIEQRDIPKQYSVKSDPYREPIE